MFCTNCGAPMEGSAKFCTRCGATAPAAAAVPVPTQPRLAHGPGPGPAAAPSVPVPAKKGLPLALIAIVLIAILAIAAVGAFLLLGSGSGGGLIQGAWVRTGMCGETWRLEFRGFGSLVSTETEYDGLCNVVSAPQETGSYSAQDQGDRFEAWFWDTYRATVWKSDPNSLTVHLFDDSGNHLRTWGFTRA